MKEHADLGRRAARRGKTANLTAGRQDPVAGNKAARPDFWPSLDQHRAQPPARRRVPSPECHRSRCVAPSDPPRRRVDLREERVLMISERVRLAKEIGATDRDLAPLLNELIYKPLVALDRYQDKGVIEHAEIPSDRDRR